jgi:hypothetical protein
MEVHHHPNLHHERKPWKEYALEGLMIFLAVFMGFIAENVREHIVEKNRVKDYAKEMVENLKYDTIRCSKNRERNEAAMQGIDSLRGELKRAIAGHIDGNKLYYLVMKYRGEINSAVFNSSAITELKNSGSLRLIDNKKLVAKISDYYERRITATLNAEPTGRAEVLKTLNDEFFSLEYFDGMVAAADKMDNNFYTPYDYRQILEMKPVPQLLKTKPADLRRFYNGVVGYEVALKTYDFFLNYVKQAAIPLMADIRTEYKLKDD